MREVCEWCVCQQYNSENCERVSTKFSVWIGLVLRKIRLSFLETEVGCQKVAV